MLIRSASGLRGIAEDHFTPELIDQYISAFIITQNIKSVLLEETVGFQENRLLSG